MFAFYDNLSNQVSRAGQGSDIGHARSVQNILTVLSAKGLTIGPENRPSWRAMAKAPNNLFRLLLLNSSRKTLSLIPLSLIPTDLLVDWLLD